MYERIAVAFVVLTVVLLLGILYLSVARATIRVEVKPRPLAVTATADVTATGGEASLAGAVKDMTLERSRVFTLPGEGATAVPEKAFGQVTIKNETGTTQPLVATTRVLSESGILFRLVRGTTVPARGEVTVDVQADVPGKAGEIGPSRFTIPGLNTTLQQSIYAVSTQPMQGGVQYVRTLTEEDIASAVAELTEAVRAEALATLQQGIDPEMYSGTALTLQEVSRATSVPVGTATGSFELKLEFTVQFVAFQEKAVQERGVVLLNEQVPEGFGLDAASVQSGRVKVLSMDAARQTARIALDVTGNAYMEQRAEALRPGRFLGRSPAEVQTLLTSVEDVAGVTLSFMPFWLKRVPTLEDHVSMVIIRLHDNAAP